MQIVKSLNMYNILRNIVQGKCGKGKEELVTSTGEKNPMD